MGVDGTRCVDCEKNDGCVCGHQKGVMPREEAILYAPKAGKRKLDVDGDGGVSFLAATIEHHLRANGFEYTLRKVWRG